jgi:hypothetical protein
MSSQSDPGLDRTPSPQSRYTRYDLLSSVQVAAKIAEHGGLVSNTMLAAILGYKSAVNGAYMQRVAAARLFNLIEGQGQEIRITDLGRDIVEPRNDVDAARARLAAFRSVPLYNDFLNNHEGRPLPSRDAITRQIRNTYGLGDEAARLACARMISSADQAGLFHMHENMMIPPVFNEANRPAPVERPAAAPAATGASNGKVSGDYPLFVHAALSEVPWGNREGGWTEDELHEWMEWFERGMRVHLRISRRKAASEPSTGVGQS